MGGTNGQAQAAGVTGDWSRAAMPGQSRRTHALHAPHAAAHSAPHLEHEALPLCVKQRAPGAGRARHRADARD